jgi:rhodanese-related sulfurtransferase
MSASAETHPLEITIAEYFATRQQMPTQVIDVRERDEWDGGHMADATLLPLGELEQRRHELDLAAPVVIVCRSGRRSLTAAEILLEAGFQDVRSLAGGMIAWHDAGLPVER